MTDKPTIWSFDPGETTGVAKFSKDQVETSAWGKDLVFDAIAGLRPTSVVICEQFTYRPGTEKMSRQYDALHIIGALMCGSRTQGFELIFQSPSEAKTFGYKGRLESMGLWKVGVSVHEQDALRHLGLYMAKNKIVKL